MLARVPDNPTTLDAGKTQGFLALPLRASRVVVGDVETTEITTVWEPTPAELQALMKGEPVRITVLSPMMPPIKVDVGR